MNIIIISYHDNNDLFCSQLNDDIRLNIKKTIKYSRFTSLKKRYIHCCKTNIFFLCSKFKIVKSNNVKIILTLSP